MTKKGIEDEKSYKEEIIETVKGVFQKIPLASEILESISNVAYRLHAKGDQNLEQKEKTNKLGKEYFDDLTENVAKNLKDEGIILVSTLTGEEKRMEISGVKSFCEGGEEVGKNKLKTYEELKDQIGTFLITWGRAGWLLNVILNCL